MREQEFKKIIRKSSIETSDDFIDNLMSSVEKNQKAKEAHYWWSFKPVLITCAILMLIITFSFFKFLNYSESNLSLVVNVAKIPIFILITLTFLYYLNIIIKLNENLTDSK